MKGLMMSSFLWWFGVLLHMTDSEEISSWSDMSQASLDGGGGRLDVGDQASNTATHASATSPLLYQPAPLTKFADSSRAHTTFISPCVVYTISYFMITSK
jgi:hypothetical protein